MRYHSLLSIFFLSIFFYSSQAQSTSFLNNWLNPFKWLTAYSNSSALEIKPHEEVPVSKIQVLPPLDPLPIPFRMHTVAEKFDEIPKINSMDNIHIPLQMSTPSVTKKQVTLEQTTFPTINPKVGGAITNPKFPRPNFLFRKRVGLIPDQTSRMEIDFEETSTLPSTTEEPLDLTTLQTEFITELSSETATSLKSDITDDFGIERKPTAVVEKKVEKVNDTISTTQSVVKDVLEEVTTTMSSKENRPEIFMGAKPDEEEQLSVIPELRGEFLHEAEFAKYLNQFYYSKPTVFDNLYMSKV